jgi:uncharacterized protein (DUF736 family)
MENKNTNTNSDKPKLEEAGALWKRTSKAGNTYLNGSFKTKSGEEVKVLIFSNSSKPEGSNQPDYRVYFDKPLDNQTSTASKKKVVSNKSEEVPF